MTFINSTIELSFLFVKLCISECQHLLTLKYKNKTFLHIISSFMKFEFYTLESDL